MVKPAGRALGGTDGVSVSRCAREPRHPGPGKNGVGFLWDARRFQTFGFGVQQVPQNAGTPAVSSGVAAAPTGPSENHSGACFPGASVNMRSSGPLPLFNGFWRSLWPKACFHRGKGPEPEPEPLLLLPHTQTRRGKAGGHRGHPHHTSLSLNICRGGPLGPSEPGQNGLFGWGGWLALGPVRLPGGASYGPHVGQHCGKGGFQPFGLQMGLHVGAEWRHALGCDGVHNPANSFPALVGAFSPGQNRGGWHHHQPVT